MILVIKHLSCWKEKFMFDGHSNPLITFSLICLDDSSPQAHFHSSCPGENQPCEHSSHLPVGNLNSRQLTNSVSIK